MSIHLLNTDEPFKNHSDVRVNCGQLIRNGIAGFAWDNACMNVQPEYPTFNVCGKCRKKALEIEVENRQFLYAILEGNKEIG